MDAPNTNPPEQENYAGPVKALLIVVVIIIACAVFVMVKSSPENRQAGLVEKALAAVRENPNDASLRIALGSLYRDLGQHDKAIEALDAAKRMAKNDQERAQALINAGDVYQFGLKDPQKALNAYRSAEKLGPGGQLAGDLYGKLFCLCCNFKELWKEEDIVRFAEMQATYGPGAHSTIQMGIAHAIKGNKEEALKQLASVKDDPLWEYEGWNIACVYSLVGDNDTAMIHLTQFLQVRMPDLTKARFSEKLAMLRIDNTLAGVRQDPRFEALLSRFEAENKSRPDIVTPCSRP